MCNFGLRRRPYYDQLARLIQSAANIYEITPGLVSDVGLITKSFLRPGPGVDKGCEG